jgi:hypothetical protein
MKKCYGASPARLRARPRSSGARAARSVDLCDSRRESTVPLALSLCLLINRDEISFSNVLRLSAQDIL